MKDRQTLRRCKRGRPFLLWRCVFGGLMLLLACVLGSDGVSAGEIESLLWLQALPIEGPVVLGEFSLLSLQGPSLAPVEAPAPRTPPGTDTNPAGHPGDEPDEAEEPDTADADAEREDEEEEKEQEPEERKWYEKYGIRGYGQFRYNRHLETNPFVRHPQDPSVGFHRSYLLRRARLIFSGDAHERVFLYIQPDFVQGIDAERLHFLQLRDWYADIALDERKEYRFRVGQSKVPYGWENLQSSQNRIPLDRNDAFNSAAPGERDLGVFFYWAPEEIRERFRELVQSGLKGSGDYGVLGLGTYVGQSANRQERNDDLHMVARLTYPFQFDNCQFLEVGIQAYRGIFTPARTPDIGGPRDFHDKRIGWSFILYPQPLGIQAEYNIGIGPELNDERTAIQTGKLHGGYIQVFYRQEFTIGGVVIPFVRKQYYRGGTKALTNVPRQRVNEWEIGVEWEPIPALELVTLYAITDRTSTEFPYPNHKGGLLRMQVQWNY